MRKLNYLLITLLLVFNFISCSSDDDSSDIDDNISEIDTSKPSIEGSWKIIGYETQNAELTTTSIDGAQTTAYSKTGSNFDAVTVYTTEPNISKTTGSFDVTTTYSGLPPSITTITDSNWITAEWKIIDENKLISIANEKTFTTTITQLTENTLVLETDLSQSQITSSDSSLPSEMSGTLKSTFSRILE